jgi:hypothetical protein
MYKENTLLDVALRYFDMGFQPIPLSEITIGEDGKKKFRPLINWKDKGDLFFTREEVIENFSTPIAKNIALRTGKSFGLIVIDVDKGADEEFVSKHLSELKTVIVYSQGGGKHYWLKHPGFNVKTCAGELAKGIDVRGEGGIIIVPPSKTENGGFYVFQ